MPIKKINIQQFIEVSRQHAVIDVRSPGEYGHAHFPGGYSLPLFTDEERKIVGTAYKQEGKKTAIRIGLDFFGVKMKATVIEAEAIVKNFAKKHQDNTDLPAVIVHCWRGGMRSAAIAWLLDLYGFDVYLLTGGYKAYRNWVLQQFEKDYQLLTVGGYTGSGKTALLQQLSEQGQAVIDLEKIAGHRGSAFGEMGKQPSQEMFENILAAALEKNKDAATVWIEDESQRIGQLNIPNNFWATMRCKPIYFIEIPFNERLNYIVSTYGLKDKEKLVNSIIRIQKRLGPLETKTAIGFLIEADYKSCFGILLNYYDKFYNKALNKRAGLDTLLYKIACPFVDTISNTEKLLTCNTVNTC